MDVLKCSLEKVIVPVAVVLGALFIKDWLSEDQIKLNQVKMANEILQSKNVDERAAQVAYEVLNKYRLDIQRTGRKPHIPIESIEANINSMRGCFVVGELFAKNLPELPPLPEHGSLNLEIIIDEYVNLREFTVDIIKDFGCANIVAEYLYSIIEIEHGTYNEEKVSKDNKE